MLLVMVDRGHRELPIQPDFCSKRVPTSNNESISLRLNNIDNEEEFFLKSYKFSEYFLNYILKIIVDIETLNY